MAKTTKTPEEAEAERRLEMTNEAMGIYGQMILAMHRLLEAEDTDTLAFIAESPQVYNATNCGWYNAAASRQVAAEAARLLDFRERAGRTGRAL